MENICTPRRLKGIAAAIGLGAVALLAAIAIRAGIAEGSQFGVNTPINLAGATAPPATGNATVTLPATMQLGQTAAGNDMPVITTTVSGH